MHHPPRPSRAPGAAATPAIAMARPGMLVLLLVLALGACAPLALPPEPPALAPTTAPLPSAASDLHASPVPPDGALAAAPTAPSPVTPSPVTSPSLVPTPVPVEVRVGAVEGLDSAALYLAVERGYFASEGLTIALQPFAAGPRLAELVSADGLEVGLGDLTTNALRATASGRQPRLVAGQARDEATASGAYISVRRDLLARGGVRDWPQLRWRTVAVPAKAGAGEYIAHLLAARGGFAPHELDIVAVAPADMPAAFASGAIDVAIQPEPSATLAEEQGLAVRWRPLTALAARLQRGVVLYAPRFAATPAAERWLVAYLRGARDYAEAFQQDHERPLALAQLARYLPLAAAIDASDLGWPAIDPNGEVDRDSLEAQVAWLKAIDAVPRGATLDALLDPSFAAAAVERLGRY